MHEVRKYVLFVAAVCCGSLAGQDVREIPTAYSPCLSPKVPAAEVVTLDAAEPDVSFELYGKPSGFRTLMTLVIGNNISRSVKVYSEPSHTMLVGYVDNAEGDAREKAWYIEEMRGKGGGRMFFPFTPGQRAGFEAEAAPGSDTHLTVHVFGRYPGEEAPRERVYTAYTDLRAFGFRVRQLKTTALLCCSKDPDHQNECNTGCVKCSDVSISDAAPGTRVSRPADGATR